ncbi:MAG: tetratricopeptide repeat protein [Bacteroidota bacterium]
MHTTPVLSILLLFLFSLQTSFAQIQTSSYNSQANALYESGQEANKEKRYKDAKALYQAALRLDPSFVNAMDGMASVYFVNGQLDSAIYFHQASIKVNPRHLLAHQRLIATYLKRGNYENAIQANQEVLKQFRNNPRIYAETLFGMANIYFGQKDYRSALPLSEEAMRIYLDGEQSESAAQARLLAAKSHMNLANYELAIRYFKAGRKYFGNQAFHHYYLGFCYLRSGKTDKADDYLRQAELMGYQIPPYIAKEWQN